MTIYLDTHSGQVMRTATAILAGFAAAGIGCLIGVWLFKLASPNASIVHLLGTLGQ